MNFNFEKASPLGGFTNNSLFVTSYERNFDVLNTWNFWSTIVGQEKINSRSKFFLVIGNLNRRYEQIGF